ncbi:MAG: TonB family protein [Myxococcota bacterium]|nr:TonB family protein [Myxococcota bacterium]
MNSLQTLSWQDRLADQRRQRFQRAVIVSALFHLVIVAALGFAPDPPPLKMPSAITVDLVAAVPAPRAVATPKPAAPVPRAQPAPPKTKVKILPKRAPDPVRPAPVVKPKPKPTAQSQPKPDPVIQRKERPKEMSYEDALAQLRDDIGEAAPAEPAPSTAKIAAPSAASGVASGALVAPELAAWNLAVMRHVRSVWITPPEFRGRAWAAQLEINLASDGRILGSPRLVRSSGNPYFDDNAVRAVLRASPLPAPPQAGTRSLIFTSEE